MKNTFIKSKNNDLFSEDYVTFLETEKYAIMMASDGNGTMGSESSILSYKGGKGSEIAYTTEKFSKLIVGMVLRHLTVCNNAESIKNDVLKIIKPSINEYSTGFCFCLCVVDKYRNMAHCWNVGDCGFLITHPDTDMYTEFVPSAVGLVVTPNEPIVIIPAIFPNNMDDEGIVYSKNKIMDNSRIIVFSDGLGWNSHIMPADIRLSNVARRYYSPYVIERYIDKVETPTCKTSGNIEKFKLINIMQEYPSAEEIVSEVVKESFPLKRLDDFCICVYINK